MPVFSTNDYLNHPQRLPYAGTANKSAAPYQHKIPDDYMIGSLRSFEPRVINWNGRRINATRINWNNK